jgi:hypothetical protein
MPIEVQFIDGVRTLDIASATQWMRSGGYTIPVDQANAALPEMLTKTKKYGFLQHADFLRDLALVNQYGRMHGDHPPNALSVVDAHLPANVPDWILLRNNLPNHGIVATRKTLDGNKDFFYITYQVGSWPVWVVWPMKYVKHPPAPNRLGWFPQLEFGLHAGAVNPRANVGIVHFRYVTLTNEPIDLQFP